MNGKGKETLKVPQKPVQIKTKQHNFNKKTKQKLGQQLIMYRKCLPCCCRSSGGSDPPDAPFNLLVDVEGGRLFLPESRQLIGT